MKRILIVEDEEMIRKGIILTVDWNALGCTVVGEAANGEEGLAAASRLQPDLIITDLKMPRMDGIEMLQKLREQGCDTAVIILTAYDSFQYAQSALRLGAVDYLLKPFHDGDLENAILRLRSKNKAETKVLEGKSPYVREASAYIHKHYQNPEICVGSIARELGISEGHLSHLFKRETGETVLGYLTKCRIQAAMDELADCRVKVYEVAEKVGYRDIAYFSSTFKRLTGKSPSEYQNAPNK